MTIESFAGKTAFVTGGASGIGLGIARMLVDAIRNDQLYVITHGEFRNRMKERMDAILAATPHADMQF